MYTQNHRVRLFKSVSRIIFDMAKNGESQNSQLVSRIGRTKNETRWNRHIDVDLTQTNYARCVSMRTSFLVTSTRIYISLCLTVGQSVVILAFRSGFCSCLNAWVSLYITAPAHTHASCWGLGHDWG